MTKQPLPFVEEDVSKWPIYRLSLESTEFGKNLVLYVMREILGKISQDGQLSELLSKVLYMEKQRYKTMPWSVDPADEDTFWEGVKKKLLHASKQENIEGEHYTVGELQVLEDIVSRYYDEISGYFNPSTFDFANNTVRRGVSRLLNAAPFRENKKPFWDRRTSVYNRVQILGPVQKIRKLAQQHTIVVVPTHSSNLDSPVIGWLLRCIGLPAFLYGAGLNLFNFKLAGYFMSRLGAYKVDRRKKNRVYLETLQAYSTLTIHNGAHSLFFPGGTRSRSGKVETRLKQGLLGTTIEAQRLNLLNEDSKQRKVIVVTANLNYPFVLEAPVLIDQFLKKDGKSRYLKKSEPSNAFIRYVHFFYRFFRAKGRFSVSFGEPMDVFGNPVDEQGRSLDKVNKQIHLSDYFSGEDGIVIDEQRDTEYTKELSNKIVDQFLKNNRIMPIHILSKALFECFIKKYDAVDVYECIKKWNVKDIIPSADFIKHLESVIEYFKALEEEGQVQLDERCFEDIQVIITSGLEEAGMYHLKKPILKSSKGFRTENMKTLFFYQNRTEGYN